MCGSVCKLRNSTRFPQKRREVRCVVQRFDGALLLRHPFRHVSHSGCALKDVFISNAINFQSFSIFCRPKIIKQIDFGSNLIRCCLASGSAHGRRCERECRAIEQSTVDCLRSELDFRFHIRSAFESPFLFDLRSVRFTQNVYIFLFSFFFLFFHKTIIGWLFVVMSCFQSICRIENIEHGHSVNDT